LISFLCTDFFDAPLFNLVQFSNVFHKADVRKSGMALSRTAIRSSRVSAALVQGCARYSYMIKQQSDNNRATIYKPV
jgi:hypothetical protein